MQEILETVMLVCFGFSWPMSVVKNIRAKTARSMSLWFILLIIAGYIAGIAAKFVSGNTGYVLVAYFLNLAVVSVNLAVYFVNRGYDKKAAELEKEKSMAAYRPIAQPSAEMKKAAGVYRQMNTHALPGGALFFGGSLFLDPTLPEYAQDACTDEPVYFRGVKDLSVSTAEALLPDCVLSARPGKVFLCLEPGKDEDADAFIGEYQWVLHTLRKESSARVCVLSRARESEEEKECAERLRALTRASGCGFIDLSDTCLTAEPGRAVFDRVRPYLRNTPLNFADAMRLGRARA